MAEYEELVGLLKKAALVGSAEGHLHWDEQAMMPAGGAAFRAEQHAVLAELSHQAATNPRIGELLESLQGDDSLSFDQQVVLKEAATSYSRLTNRPAEYVARLSKARSAAYHAWAKARAENDFPAFVPHLEAMVELAKEEAALNGQAENAYDFHIENSDPGMTAEHIGTLFSELKTELVPLVEQILNSSVKPDASKLKGFPIPQQEAFLKGVVGQLGFDFNHGRIDTSIHPFCGGVGADIRMTTRFDEDNPLDSLTGAIHETGHALYEQGLPREHFGTGLARAVGMGVHESQSRLWENQVGRSRGFWKHFEPEYRKAFPGQLAGIGSDDFYLAVNEVKRNPIRVDSDEVTYNLHIILRFELEKQLFDGSLAVRDLSAAWQAKAEELLGLTPANDAEGVLQDIHWSGGAFGYFPSYCLGNMLAAQLWYQVNEEIPALGQQIESGDFSHLLHWLRTHIHEQGRRYDTLELTERVTGSPLSPKSLLRYLRERYLPLYGFA